MSNKNQTNEIELHKLIASYKDPLVILAEESKKEIESQFYSFAMNYLGYLATALRSFDNAYKTRPYDFFHAGDRKEFIHETLSNKIYPKSKARNIIHKIDSDKSIKTYLYSVIENAAITLIRYNEAQIRNPSGGIEPIDEMEIPVPAIEGLGKYIIKFEKDFPILNETEDFQIYPHLFFCHNRLNLEVSNFKTVENNQDERILKWRTG